jgi:hypothetical protein
VTTLKIQGRPAAVAQQGIEPYIDRLYAVPGARVVGVIELAHIERPQPAPDADKQASVTLKITHLEIAGAEQEGIVREAQRALYLQRTASGTLTDLGEVELSEESLKLTGGLLHAVETARLRAGMAHWVDYIRRCVTNDKLTLGEMRHELDTVADGMAAVLNTTQAADA